MRLQPQTPRAEEAEHPPPGPANDHEAKVAVQLGAVS
jgi:hypothetical protein